MPAADRGIAILGVNGIGLESGNATICAGRSIPWLQDVSGQDVWTSWNVEYRDVVILDSSNHVHAVYNLTVHDLADPANFVELRNLLLSAVAP